MYGVNTGFGKLAQTRIPRDKLADLQRNLVVSHACGVGALLPRDVVRLAIALKVNSLARGYSGVRWSVIETLLACLERDVLPAIPGQGSVGASGDLAPLAHLAAALIGVGDAIVGERRMPGGRSAPGGGDRAARTARERRARAAQRDADLDRARAARADRGRGRARRVAGRRRAHHRSGARQRRAVRRTDPRRARPRRPERRRRRGARLISGSAINASHRDCGRVQDPYSLRCIPQVLGACLRTLRDTAAVLVDEANAVSDNPLVFPDTGEVISGGNFHAEPVALVADAIAVAIAEIGNISERRTALLVDPTFSQLPAFLATDPGLESGYMIAQVTAAALASENKGLAHPASVDTIPTSAGQEDHVSMATHGARRLDDMLRNCANIVAVELLSAARGIALRRPLRTSAALEAVLTQISPAVSTGDQYLSPEIERVAALVRSGRFTSMAAELFATTAPGSNGARR